MTFLRISCAGRNALPVAGFHRSRKIFFTADGAISFLNSVQNFSADLTIAVLGRIAMPTYHPDTLFDLADKKFGRSRSLTADAPDLTGLLSCARAGIPEKARGKVHETKTHHPLR